MTTYNTGNPLGSSAPKDLYDNAQVVDNYANDIANETTLDRFGRQRLTLHGVEKRADAVFANLGFFPPVDYATGLTVDSRNFTVTYGGVVYAAQPSAVPFTTGAWDAAQWYPIQNVLNQKNLLVFDTYAEASAAAATLPEGQSVQAPDVDGRASKYVVEDGALVFADYAADIIRLASYADIASYSGKSEAVEIVAHGLAGVFYRRGTKPANGGVVIKDALGRSWERAFDGSAHVGWFGAKGDAVADDTAAQNSATEYVQNTYDPAAFASDSPANGPCSLQYHAGLFRTNGTIAVHKKVAFRGDGPAEFSSGTRLIQFNPAVDLFKISPIAQGMSVSFENMALRGAGTGAGSLINIERTTAGCNSQRYYNMVFGTPPTLSMRIQVGDDIIIDNCLFDVSALDAISLGTSLEADAVSNVRINSPAFFAVNRKCIVAYNIDGLQIACAQVYPNGAGRTQYFIDGYQTLPKQIKDVSIIGGNFKSVDCLVKATDVLNMRIVGITGSDLGKGSGATDSAIKLVGTNVGFTLTGSTLSGSFDTKHFYDDSGAVVSNATITGNTFVNTGGSGQALVCGNTSGVIANNTFVGFAQPSVSETVVTSGNAISPGVIVSMSSYTKTFTVVGARQGDKVRLSSASTEWMCPIGIEIVGFISDSNTVSVSYRNLTGSPIGVPAHDITYCVERGI